MKIRNLCFWTSLCFCSVCAFAETKEYLYMEMPEFLEKYGIPRKGSKEKDERFADKAKRFDENFYGLIIDGQKFAVIRRRNIEHSALDYGLITLDYNLLDASGRAARCSVWVADSEQASLNIYPDRYWASAGPKSRLVERAERIPWGTFCRRIKDHGGMIDFVNGTLGVRMNIRDEKPIDLLPAGKEIDALFRGNAEFLPEDDPELVSIRKAHQEAQERRARELREESERREQERREAERREIVEKCLLPNEFYEERAELGSEIEAFSARMKEKGGNVFSDAASASRPPVIPLTASVPAAGERDAEAWRKLSVSRARSVFSDWEEWRNVAEDWHPLFFSFRMHKTRKLPGDSETDWVSAEVVHAGTPADARKWAAYLRFKYMDESERSRGDAPEQIASATNADAFSGLGDGNISWRGRMSPAFLPDEKTAETLIVFIRGTTVVCLKSERPDFSVLPFARAFDALLLAPAPAAAETR